MLDERLSPLYVSIHATDPDVRARMLRNPRGATSLRWLHALLEGGIEVHGQIVVCPGVNDGDVLADTLLGVLDRYPSLATLAVVPLGVSSHQREAAMRPHTNAEAGAVVDLCEQWQKRFLDLLGRRLVFAADEYYLLAGRPFPPDEHYGDFPMHEDGIGMARAFEAEFCAAGDVAVGGTQASDDATLRPRAPAAGFFAWVDGAPAEGYRASRAAGHGANRSGEIDLVGQSTSLHPVAVTLPTRLQRAHGVKNGPIAILTGTYGAAVLRPLVANWRTDMTATGAAPPEVRIIEVPNDFFGGNIGVTGLLAGSDIAAVLEGEPAGHRYLLADVCLSGGAFLDGLTPNDLPHPVDIVPTNGAALRRHLDAAAGAKPRHSTGATIESTTAS